MFSRVVRALALLLILAASIGALASAGSAAAQTAESDNDDSCISCHEDLYLLHDLGKWYCLCEVRARCTYCHGGVPGALDEQTGHQGMVANPVQHGTTPCQSCHPADHEARLATFAARAGLSPSPCPTAIASSHPIAPPAAPAPRAGLAPWQVVMLSLIGAAFAGLVWVAYRCWEADCMQRRTLP